MQADRDAVTQAQAALASARANAAQDKSGDVQAAQADAQKALDDWRYAADQLARTRITAPFSGTIQTIASETADSLRPLQPGDAVTAGQALLTIAGDTGFIVRARVDEQDVSQVRAGQRAIVSGKISARPRSPATSRWSARSRRRATIPRTPRARSSRRSRSTRRCRICATG